MDPTRRQVFFHWLRSVVKADVVLLQETHCNTVARAQRWSREWGGLDRASRRNECERVAWFSLSSSPHQGGSAILVSKKFLQSHNITAISTTQDHNGGWVHMTVLHKLTKIELQYSSIYLPPQDTPRLAAIEDLPPRPHCEWLAAGDFNCVELSERDAKDAKYNAKGGEQLATYTAQQNLSDVWIHTNPGDPGFTRKHSATQSTRIDRLYTTPSFLAHTQNLTLLTSPISDHHALVAEIKMSLRTSLPTPYWRLNTSILRLPETDFIVQTIIGTALEERGNQPIIGWWLRLKHTLVTQLKKHTRVVTRERNKKFHDLHDKLNHTSTPPESLPSLQAEYYELLRIRQDKVRLMAGAKREEIGDTPTASFFAAAAARAAARGIHSITPPKATPSSPPPPPPLTPLTFIVNFSLSGRVCLAPPAMLLAPPPNRQQQRASRWPALSASSRRFNAPNSPSHTHSLKYALLLSMVREMQHQVRMVYHGSSTPIIGMN